jgi:uncharacterized membrane protein YkvA (DUF1232 family)
MKKAKPKRGVAPKHGRRGIPREKAALRSEAFARALADAKLHVNDPDRLRILFTKAANKAATVPKEPFKENWPYLQAMLRLIRACHRGEYSPVTDDAFLWIIAALNYFVDPFDLIPDEVPFLGFVDDAAVLEFGVEKTKSTLDDFMIWETTKFQRE